MTTTLWDRSPGAGGDGTDSDPAGSEVPPAEGAGPVTATRRPRLWLLTLVLVAVVLAVGVLFVSTGPGPATTAPLDPRNPTATGAQALARVLQAQGVQLDVARGQVELARATIDEGTTVLVAATSALGDATSRELTRLTSNAERLVVVAPDRSVVRLISPSVGVTEVRRGESDLVAAGCTAAPGTVADVRDGETLSRSQSEFQATSATSACFTHDAHSVYLEMPRTATTAPLVLLGSATALTNDQITEASNAAIVLRILGHSGRLVWYVPSANDLPAGDSRTPAPIPHWIGPGLALGCVAFFGVVLWRGRRLGRLVPEPLPVVVRAVETTESRGRLYRRARDASRAGSVLQQATSTRLADYLGLPRPSSAPHAATDQGLVRAVSAASGRGVDEVGTLLLGPPPSRDDHLLGLAVELAALEKEVRRL